VSQLIGIVGSIALVAGVIFLLRNAGDSGSAREKELFKLCRGDREMMERLIAHEEQRKKGRSRNAAIKAAIQSLQRDNR
jgi:hypothetical protein